MIKGKLNKAVWYENVNKWNLKNKEDERNAIVFVRIFKT